MSGGNGEEAFLVRRFIAGEAGAFEEIFHEHSGWVFRRCLAMLGDRQDAEDLTQEIFLTLYQKRHVYRGECSLGVWVRRICDHRCIDFLRRRAREGRLMADYRDVVALNGDPYADPDPIESDPDLPDEDGDVQRALAALPDRDRKVLVLHYMEEQSYTDIAQELGWSVGRVKVTVHRAKEKFRRAFDSLGPRREQVSCEESAAGSMRS